MDGTGYLHLVAEQVLSGLQLGRNSDGVNTIVVHEKLWRSPGTVGELATVVNLEPDLTVVGQIK